ncbi:hypothetical protein WA158_004837 [Blastocystis sp. Blastoise]
MQVSTNFIRYFSINASNMSLNIPVRSYLNRKKYMKLNTGKAQNYMQQKQKKEEENEIIAEIVGQTQAYKEYEKAIEQAAIKLQRKYDEISENSKGVSYQNMQIELQKEREKIAEFYHPLIYKESHALKRLYDTGKISIHPKSFHDIFMDTLVEVTSGEQKEQPKQIENKKK